MKRLHPNAIAIFYIQGLFLSAFFLGGPLFAIFVALIESGIKGNIEPIWGVLYMIFSTAIIFLLPLFFAQLAYKNYRYELTEEGLNMKKGFLWKKHVSIPYKKIQNVDIIQGPVARMLGITNLLVQTAGLSGVAMVEGQIPAIAPEEAERLRDQILAKVAGTREQGL